MSTRSVAVLGTVYLLHFTQPYRHARHYTGWASDLPARLVDHATGHGARLLEVITAAGIGWTLARTWPNATRGDERALKNQGGASRRCPLCGGGSAALRAAPLPQLPLLLGIDPATGQPRTHAVCEVCQQRRGLLHFDLADPTCRTCLICQQRPARYQRRLLVTLNVGRPAW